MVLEVVASEVFEDIPQRGNKTEWDKQIPFKAPRVSSATTNELFDEKVIWDEELLDSWDSGSFLECKQGDITIPVLSKCEDFMVSGLLSPVDVVWDEDVHSMLDFDRLLQQFALGTDNFVGEHWVSAQQKQVPIQTSVIWDDESTHSFDSDDGLLQLLAGGGEFSDLEKPEQVVFDSLQQGGENLIGKDKQSTADSNNISGVSSSLELNNDSVLLEEQYHSEVIWDDDLFSDLDYSGGLSPDQLCCVDAFEGHKTSLVDEQVTQNMLFAVNSPSRVQGLVVVASAKVFAVRPFKDDASVLADLATFIAPGASKDAAREVLNDMHNFDWPIFDEMPTGNVLKDAIISHDGLLLVHAKLAANAMEQQRCDPLMAERVEFATPKIVRFTEIVKPQWRRNDFSLWECELQLEDSSVKPEHQCLFSYEAKLQPWNLNAFSSRIFETTCHRYTVDMVQSWKRNGFSPGSCVLNRRSIAVTSDLPFSYEAFKSVSFADAYWIKVLYKKICISDRQWDPGIWHLQITYTLVLKKKFSLYKVAASVRRQWDPGIMTIHISQWFGCALKVVVGVIINQLGDKLCFAGTVMS
ncbi:unnamed protein product [Urochloa humidicola]